MNLLRSMHTTWRLGESTKSSKYQGDYDEHIYMISLTLLLFTYYDMVKCVESQAYFTVLTIFVSDRCVRRTQNSNRERDIETGREMLSECQLAKSGSCLFVEKWQPHIYSIMTIENTKLGKQFTLQQLTQQILHASPQKKHIL